MYIRKISITNALVNCMQFILRKPWKKMNVFCRLNFFVRSAEMYIHETAIINEQLYLSTVYLKDRAF